MLFKLLLKPHQRNAVPFFHRYVLKAKRERESSDDSDLEQVDQAQTAQDMATEPLWEALDFDNNQVDRLIMFEITKRRVACFETEFDS